MAVSVRSNVKLLFNVIQTDSDEQNKSCEHKIEVDETRAYGAAINQIDAVYSDKPLALAGSPVTLDLQSLTDAFGAALSFAKIFRIVIRNKSTVAGEDLTVGAAATNAWEPFVASGQTVTVPDGSEFCWSDVNGVTVDASNKDLKLDPGANTFNVDLLIIGTKS